MLGALGLQEHAMLNVLIDFQVFDEEANIKQRNIHAQFILTCLCLKELHMAEVTIPQLVHLQHWHAHTMDIKVV